MRILCLILASDTRPEHVKFQSVWRTFMTKHPSVDCYFYKAHPDLECPSFVEDRTLWIRTRETFDTVYEKTIRAFEHFLPQLSTYDYVYRSNLSTAVSFSHMLEFCSDLPRVNCCAAVTGGIDNNLPMEKRNSLECPFSFPGGNGFILSIDLVRRLVEDREPLVHQDDVTIGNALRRWKVPIREFVRPDFNGNKMWYINNYDLLKPYERNMNPKKIMFTYRFKSNNREEDVEEMRRYIKKLYNV